MQAPSHETPVKEGLFIAYAGQHPTQFGDQRIAVGRDALQAADHSACDQRSLFTSAHYTPWT